MKSRGVLVRSVLVVGIVVSCGCRAMVSESQRARNNDTPGTALVSGQTLSLEAELQYGPTYKSTKSSWVGNDVKGRLVVRAPEEIVAKIDLYHFSMRPAKGMYYVQNFGKDRNGNWRHVDGSPVEVTVTREPGAVVVDFKWIGWASTKIGATAFDVGVSMQIDGEVHRLARQAVPIQPPAQ